MDLIPRPTSAHFHGGSLTELAHPSEWPSPEGPAEIVELVREVFGRMATGTYSLDDSAHDLGDEGYRLAITATGVRASARTAAGLRWAVATLRQLADHDFPLVDITDIPRYAWRGALLDVARWCHPISFVRTFIDAMSLHKLNTLHLHLTDDQGWRFEVLKYPRLTEIGSVRQETSVGLNREVFDGVPHGGFYTQEELRSLVAYAARRGVRIMPEVDLPGHMQAALSAYPALGNDPSRTWPVRTTWGISSHILNCEPSTVDFVRDVLDELIDVFPFELVHLGGDEVPPDEWHESMSAQAVARAAGLPDVTHLVGWWIREMGLHLARYGRRVAGWDELLDAGAPAGATIFAWRNNSYVKAATRAGHDVVACPQEYVYLDWAESSNDSEPLAIPNGITTLERVASFVPGDVLGVQGQIWSEYLPRPELVGYRAYPRLAAIAEIGWAGSTSAEDLRSRFRTHRRRLNAIGMAYRWK